MTTSTSASDSSRQRLGAFQVVREIGRSGMGVVFEGPLRPTVRLMIAYRRAFSDAASENRRRIPETGDHRSRKSSRQGIDPERSAREDGRRFLGTSVGW